MKRTAICGFAVAAALTLGLRAVRADDKKANTLLQSGLTKETVKGDVKGAIDQYEKAVKEAGSNRALASKALLRVGAAYQKLGEGKAQAAFERIVRDYGDQPEASEARTRLAGLRPAAVGTQSAGQSAGMTKRRLPGVVSSASSISSVSFDGRYMAFGGQGPLILRDLQTGLDRPVAEGRNLLDGYSLSSDGRQLAYVHSEGEPASQRAFLRISNLQGTGLPPFRTLMDDPSIESISVYDWTMDGREIVASVKRRERPREYGLVSVADGSLRVLPGNLGQPHLSPDGKYLAYCRPASGQGGPQGGQEDIFILALEGNIETKVVEHPANDHVMGWSPDGKYLLFTSNRNFGSQGFYALAVEDGKARTGRPELVDANIGNVAPWG